jgi:CRP/FNR family transcriptional regulator, anaerobic regulatory protein
MSAKAPAPASNEDRFLAAFGSAFPAGDFPGAKLGIILGQLRFRDMAPGDVLLREGQVCGSVPFVIEGSIRVFKSAESGREITLYRIERGQSCILSMACGQSISSFPVNVVVEAPTSAAFFPVEVVRRLFSESEAFRAFALDQYSRRMAEIMELVEEVAFRRVDERLAQLLVESASGSPDKVVKATHQRLADHVGTSREVVSRILKDWEERKALELSRGELRLLPGFADLRL